MKPWTVEEEKFLRKHYRKDNRNYLTVEALAFLLDRTPTSVVGKLGNLKLRQRRKGHWRDYELQFLADNYGRMPIKDISRRLKRSEAGIRLIAKRRLRINQKTNIYTARALAAELGISCAKIIVAWHNRGYLKGQPAPFMNGPNNVWWFDYDDIIECLQRRPWLLDLKKMHQSFFRSIVRGEWEKDPWYTKEEAGKFLGLADGNPVYRYIKKGWLPAVRRPMGGGKGAWILRHSDLAEFQLNDPRPLHRKGVSLPLTIEHALEKAETST